MKIKIDKKISVKRKININKPLSGSLANVWTEFKIPDLTKKVPVTLSIKVNRQRTITQKYNKFLFSFSKIRFRY